EATLQEETLNLYRQATSGSATTRTQALLNQLRLLVDLKRWSEAKPLVAKISTKFAKMPPGGTAVYPQFNFARSLIDSNRQESTSTAQNNQPSSNVTVARLSPVGYPAQLLNTALRQARDLQDPRAESFALGNLGTLYEQDAVPAAAAVGAN